MNWTRKQLLNIIFGTHLQTQIVDSWVWWVWQGVQIKTFVWRLKFFYIYVEPSQWSSRSSQLACNNQNWQLLQTCWLWHVNFEFLARRLMIFFLPLRSLYFYRLFRLIKRLSVQKCCWVFPASRWQFIEITIMYGCENTPRIWSCSQNCSSIQFTLTKIAERNRGWATRSPKHQVKTSY